MAVETEKTTAPGQTKNDPILVADNVVRAAEAGELCDFHGSISVERSNLVRQSVVLTKGAGGITFSENVIRSGPWQP